MRATPPSGVTWRSYYFAGSTRIAVRVQTATNVLYYLHGDHLGSTSLATTSGGAAHSRQLYTPWGESRWSSGSLPTDLRFTGQRSEEAGLGSLYDYGARFYSPRVGRFLSADTIVPSPGNPQSLNRYSYTLNNPVKYTDPGGHMACLEGDFCVRFTDDGSYRIARGGSVFVNRVEVAYANLILSGGDQVYMDALPGGSPLPMMYTTAGVEVELGYRENRPGTPDIASGVGAAFVAKKWMDEGGNDILPAGSAPVSKRPNLFRGGNRSSPKIDNVRTGGPDPDVDMVDGMVQPGNRGMSTWDDKSHIGPGNYVWKYPAGAPIPEGLEVYKDPLPEGHWSWRASGPVSLESYKEALRSTEPYWQRMEKVR
jgi:RHS repeat-associated protein